jgi:hypothetical protein
MGGAYNDAHTTGGTRSEDTSYVCGMWASAEPSTARMMRDSSCRGVCVSSIDDDGILTMYGKFLRCGLSDRSREPRAGSTRGSATMSVHVSFVGTAGDLPTKNIHQIKKNVTRVQVDLNLTRNS